VALSLLGAAVRRSDGSPLRVVAGAASPAGEPGVTGRDNDDEATPPEAGGGNVAVPLGDEVQLGEGDDVELGVGTGVVVGDGCGRGVAVGVGFGVAVGVVVGSGVGVPSPGSPLSVGLAAVRAKDGVLRGAGLSAATAASATAPDSAAPATQRASRSAMAITMVPPAPIPSLSATNTGRRDAVRPA
jgi:hypothetical protein